MQTPPGPQVALDDLITRLIIANTSARTRNERARRRVVRSPVGGALPLIPASASPKVDDRRRIDVAATPKTERATAEQPMRASTKAERMSAYMAWTNYALCHHGQGPPGEPLCPRL
jgi:hypothetical protein